ncbi:hypothetical protein CONPUDRAFT_79267 [Coniophora puteana RWD-64-598 SS2]|uniref:Uncharacterized protein n=1 Tax=Coniophora puteana (strain RWD-64-598) TaxID=741705 RepID=A0A5M3N6P0_CONPW|nr:uncharacterized protein CONPUDRAFT_79267 [Coniophora puteana RWD-64-598 SS2]EIW87102.1 hypothetical protein CONPUDRAFT_79267 [Coniophora puteana RWD-64-598 SS2]
MAASSRKTKEHESFMDLLSPHSPDREDAQPRPPTNKHERILGIETSAVQNKHRRTSLLAPPRPPMPRCITASNLEEQMTFAPNSSDSVPPSPLNFDDPTPDNVSVRSNVSSIQFARRTPSPVASDSDSPRRSHFNPSSTSLASLAPIEFAEPPSPVYVRKPSLPRESKPQFDRDKKPPYLSKRSASASPHLHSIALPPEESNKLCASDREALIRRNRKIAQVFGQTPGTMTMATDSYFKDASPVILQPEEDASRFLKLLPQSALSALLGSARQKDKSHRHAMSVSVAMRSATGPPSAKALKDGPGPLSPWQVVESPWAIEGRRHSSPLSPEKAAFLDPAADLLGDHRHHQHHYQQLHHHHQTGTTHAASATDTARDRDSPDQLQQEWNARLRAYKLLQDQGQQQPSPLRTNKPRNLSPSSSFIDLSDEEGPPTALPSSPSHARTRGRSSPPPPPSSSSPGTASAWDKSSISSGGTVHRVSRSASIADSASVLSLGSLASRTSQEMAEIERRQKRDRLAKLHRFLGSRVPADLVIGPGAMPGDTSGLPPLAYGSPDGRSWAAQGGGGGGGRSSSRNRSGSGSAVITPPQYERIKEELGGEEKALNVRRAQKMEKVFGAAPPQTLYHTRPLPIPPCLVPGSVPGAAARTVSQPTSPLGPSPSVDGTGLSSSSQFQFQPPHQSQSQFPSHSQSHSQSQSQQFQQLPPPSPSSPTSSRNPNQSAYTKSKHKGKRQYRPSTSESAHPLIPKRRGSDASIKSIVGVGIGVGVGTGSAGAGGNWPSYQDVLARSSVYVNYQHSLNSLNDIIDRDDKESLAELHRYLHGDPGSSDEEEDDDDDDDDDEGEVINIGRDDDDAEHQEDGRDTPTYPLPTTTTTTTSSGASIKSERRHSLPVRASMASLAPSELTVSTPDPEQRAFQLRRRRAAKLTNFFGVDYRELIQDVLESIEKGVEEEHRRGTLQPDEVEELLMKLRTLKTKRRSNFAR